MNRVWFTDRQITIADGDKIIELTREECDYIFNHIIRINDTEVIRYKLIDIAEEMEQELTDEEIAQAVDNLYDRSLDKELDRVDYEYEIETILEDRD